MGLTFTSVYQEKIIPFRILFSIVAQFTLLQINDKQM